MRRLTKIAAVTAVLALALTGCGKKDSQTTARRAAASPDVCESGGNGPKVGLAYDVGGRGDQSFNDSAYAGLKKAVEDLDATCIEGRGRRRSSPSPPARTGCAPWPTRATTRSSAVGFAYTDDGQHGRAGLPRRSASPSSTASTRRGNDNVAYLASPRAGLLPGRCRRRPEDQDRPGRLRRRRPQRPIIRSSRPATRRASRRSTPKIKVDDEVPLEEADQQGFADPAGGKTAATALYDDGADIVYHASGVSGAGVFDGGRRPATASGRSASTPTSTSPRPRRSRSTSSPRCSSASTSRSYDLIKAVNDGKTKPGFDVYDLKGDGVGYSTSGGFSRRHQVQDRRYKAKIKSGEIKVPNEL